MFAFMWDERYLVMICALPVGRIGMEVVVGQAGGACNFHMRSPMNKKYCRVTVGRGLQ